MSKNVKALVQKEKGMSLGTANNKWNSVYLEEGVMQLSDENAKDILGPMTEKYEELFLLLEPVLYKLKNEPNDTRIHLGIGAQTTKKHMDEVGLAQEEFGGYWEEIFGDVTEIGLDYDQISVLTLHMLQKSLKRIDELEKEVAALKG